MNALYRNSRFVRSNPFRSSELAVPAGPLAPDITTDSHLRPTPANVGVAATRASPGQVPAAQSAQIRESLSILEARHPDIIRAISLLWGFPEMNQYFDRLWLADGSHGPIDPDAMSELMLLSRLHQMIVPQQPGRSLAQIYGSNRLYDRAPAGRDPWSDVPPRR